MTVNRLTDEQLKEMCDPNLYAIRERTMAQELLTLRKENEVLRKRVEVGEECASMLRSMLDEIDSVGAGWLDAATEMTNFSDLFVMGVIVYVKWRESEDQNET